MADALTGVRVLLEVSCRRAAAGRALIDRAIELRNQAFTIIPPGTTLRFNVTLPTLDCTFTLTEEGEWMGTTCLDGVTKTAAASREWVLEQWMRGNLTVPPAPEEP